MRRKRIIEWTIVGVLVVVAVIVVALRLTGGTPPVQADITFTIALDTGQQVGSAYEVRYLPATVLIDDEGVVRGTKIGAFRSKDELLDWLDELTSAESTPPLSGVAPRIGHVAPEFSLPTLGGDTVDLSQLRGKWVLVNFWASWCHFCVVQQPYLQAAHEEKWQQVEFIGVNLGESEATVRRHIEG